MTANWLGARLLALSPQQLPEIISTCMRMHNIKPTTHRLSGKRYRAARDAVSTVWDGPRQSRGGGDGIATGLRPQISQFSFIFQ